MHSTSNKVICFILTEMLREMMIETLGPLLGYLPLASLEAGFLEANLPNERSSLATDCLDGY